MMFVLLCGHASKILHYRTKCIISTTVSAEIAYSELEILVIFFIVKNGI